MTLREQVIAMADATLLTKGSQWERDRTLALAVAAMVAEHEREACAKVCVQIASPNGVRDLTAKHRADVYYCDDGVGCAAAIRARKEEL